MKMYLEFMYSKILYKKEHLTCKTCMRHDVMMFSALFIYNLPHNMCHRLKRHLQCPIHLYFAPYYLPQTQAPPTTPDSFIFCPILCAIDLGATYNARFIYILPHTMCHRLRHHLQRSIHLYFAPYYLPQTQVPPTTPD